MKTIVTNLIEFDPVSDLEVLKLIAYMRWATNEHNVGVTVTIPSWINNTPIVAHPSQIVTILDVSEDIMVAVKSQAEIWEENHRDGSLSSSLMDACYVDALNLLFKKIQLLAIRLTQILKDTGNIEYLKEVKAWQSTRR